MIPEGTTEVFACSSSSSSNPASTITWIMSTGDGEHEVTGHAVEVTPEGHNNGRDVNSKLSLNLTRDTNAQNLTCHVKYEGNTIHSYTYQIQVLCK